MPLKTRVQLALAFASLAGILASGAAFAQAGHGQLPCTYALLSLDVSSEHYVRLLHRCAPQGQGDLFVAHAVKRVRDVARSTPVDTHAAAAFPWAEVIPAFAWPLVVLLIAVWFRREISALARRVRSLGFQKFTIQLQELPQFSAGNSLLLKDIAEPEMAAVGPQRSDTAAIIAALALDKPAAYVCIDLGDGKQWLTSRIVLLVSLLIRYRNVKLCAFVQTTGEGIARFFVGVVPCGDVVLAYPEYRIAALNPDYGPTPQQAVVSAYIRAFLRAIQVDLTAPKTETSAEDAAQLKRAAASVARSNQTGPDAPELDVTNDERFIKLEKRNPYAALTTYYELAAWTNGQSLQKKLRNRIDQAAIIDNARSREQRIRAIVFGGSQSYAVLVNNRYQFQTLCDRLSVLDQIARSSQELNRNRPAEAGFSETGSDADAVDSGDGE